MESYHRECFDIHAFYRNKDIKEDLFIKMEFIGDLITSLCKLMFVTELGGE